MEQVNHGSIIMHNPDLISALPDCLLLHILSLLNMEEVIKTSLLSRRWRYLWKSIPCLYFQPFARLFGKIELTNFIDRCLFHYEGSKIREFHVSFHYEGTHARLADSWIHFAIRCKVEDFKLHLFGAANETIPCDELYKIPHSLYLSTTLTSLTLCGCDLNLPDSFQLGSLKKLSLHIIELNPDSIEHLSSSCPSLEDIYLEDCNRESDLNIVITNEHVKRLEISRYGYGISDTLKVNAPTLLSLRIFEFCPSVRFHVEELGSLMSADITGEQDFSITFDESDRMNLEELLYDLRHVKHLKLCSWCVQVLSIRSLQSLDLLSISATCLELQASLTKLELPGISFLLESCSNLEKLKIVNTIFCDEIELSDEFIDKHDFEEEEYWDSLETGLPPTMQKINTIEINDFHSKNHEEFVRFLLKNAKVLERMVINTPKGYAKNFELLFKLTQRLIAFPRWTYHHYCAMVMTLVSLTWEINGQPDCACTQAERSPTVLAMGCDARICNASTE